MPILIHLIYNYRPGLVGFELVQNICEGRGCHVNILTNKRWKDLSKGKKPSQIPMNAIINIIEPRQNIKLK